MLQSRAVVRSERLKDKELCNSKLTREQFLVVFHNGVLGLSSDTFPSRMAMLRSLAYTHSIRYRYL